MKDKLNILYDGRIFKYGLDDHTCRTGIYFVAKNILLELINRHNVNLFLYLPKKFLKYSTDVFASLDIDPLVVISDDADLLNIDAYFSAFDVKPNFIENFPNVSCYSVLYDIIPLLFPDYFSDDIFNDYMLPLIKSLKSEDYYFSISNNTKKDFLKYFPQINNQNIDVIPLSSNIPYKPNQDRTLLNSVFKKYNLPTNKKYLFSLCSLEPRKNLLKAISTFLEFIKKNNITDLVYVLGGTVWEKFKDQLEKETSTYKELSEYVFFIGYVDDADLEVLYSNAEWFVYTSQYEGFGLPPLEAMSCGCPVITSNNSSLPEVVGDAGIMIDWDNDIQHIQAYEKYYYDKKYKEAMSLKGLERSKLFSWKSCVDVILEKMTSVEAKKSNTPLVTIITPTFNLIKAGRKDWFIQNIESVRSQTYKNIEHIIIDGSSTDETLEILDEYQSKGWIKYYSESDKGIYDALNKGIVKASGKYVVCLNSDDFYCNNNAVEWLVKKAEETEADACCASTKMLNPITNDIVKLWNSSATRDLIFGAMACHQTFLIRKVVMLELGLYDLNYKISSDTAFMYKMLQANKRFVLINPLIVTYRLGGASFDASAVRKDVTKALFENYGKYHYLLPFDCKYLFGESFKSIPLDQAIRLGSKLVYSGNSSIVLNFFEKLLHYKIQERMGCLSTHLNETQEYLNIKLDEILNASLNKNKIYFKYCRYKILAKILFGKKRIYYKQKSESYHNTIRTLRIIRKILRSNCKL